MNVYSNTKDYNALGYQETEKVSKAKFIFNQEIVVKKLLEEQKLFVTSLSQINTIIFHPKPDE